MCPNKVMRIHATRYMNTYQALRTLHIIISYHLLFRCGQLQKIRKKKREKEGDFNLDSASLISAALPDVVPPVGGV